MSDVMYNNKIFLYIITYYNNVLNDNTIFDIQNTINLNKKYIKLRIYKQ